MQGVAGEDKIELNHDESKAVKLRSRKLLLSLIYPVRGRLLFSLLIVVLSQALRVAFPIFSQKMVVKDVHNHTGIMAVFFV